MMMMAHCQASKGGTNPRARRARSAAAFFTSDAPRGGGGTRGEGALLLLCRTLAKTTRFVCVWKGRGPWEGGAGHVTETALGVVGLLVRGCLTPQHAGAAVAGTLSKGAAGRVLLGCFRSLAVNSSPGSGGRGPRLNARLSPAPLLHAVRHRPVVPPPKERETAPPPAAAPVSLALAMALALPSSVARESRAPKRAASAPPRARGARAPRHDPRAPRFLPECPLPRILLLAL